MTAPDPVGIVIPVGKYAGTPFTRLRQSYLRHLIRCQSEYAALARAELARRGAIVPTVEVTAHAIDRASLCALDLWIAQRHPNEGLASWLVRVTAIAVKRDPTPAGLYPYRPLLLAIDTDGEWPLLKTVIHAPAKSAAAIKEPDPC